MDKEVGYVDILEASTEDGTKLQILCFKDPDYVVNIMD